MSAHANSILTVRDSNMLKQEKQMINQITEHQSIRVAEQSVLIDAAVTE